MKDAIGGGMLFNLVIIFVVAIVVLFISSLSYTKAFKVKNRIIEIIEKHGIYEGEGDAASAAINEIHSNLNKVGYSVGVNDTCSDDLNGTKYKYCVYKKTTKDSSTYYYEVVTYVNFALPVINEILDIPVRGETKILGNEYNY